ncbi:sigma factor regulatory protein HasS [Alcanivorax xiamenensis]|uniref:Sigma factor regulatory protein HasS n=1 Tax=Alcanivorax xiamenensis TaxID=1177156 RepID=A0ABQ6YB27_9GAMM|nr:MULTISPECIES: FecR domain-containing protein [Alcanivorax]KAF0807148.1 sigma factor regulatory protein HasS [Alcanivorax xiamenensis]
MTTDTETQWWIVDHEQGSDDLDQRAAEWVVQQHHGDWSEVDHQRLRQWLGQDEAHQRAYRRAQRAWQLSGQLADDPVFQTPPSRRARRFRLTPALATAAALLALVMVWRTGPWIQEPGDFVTQAGEIRTLTLEDGSQVQLAGDSALDVDYSDQERRVRLRRGEAIFSPAPRAGQEKRSFVVEAGGTESRALGTRYAVRLDDPEGGWIGVLEHSIRVSSNDRGQNRDLAEGHSLTFNAGQFFASDLLPSQEAGWSRGLLIFRQQSLASVAERLRRFGAGRAVFLDTEKASRPISAVFRLDNLDRAWATLEQELDLRTLHLAGVTLIY